MFKEMESEASIAAIDAHASAPASDRKVWVRHGQMIRAVRKCGDGDRSFGRLEMITSQNGKDCLAAFEVNDQTIPMSNGNSLWFCAINSNSGKRGSRYFGAVSVGETPIVFDMFPLVSHSKNLDLQRKTSYAFDLFSLRSTQYQEKAAQLQARFLSEDEAEWLFYKAMLKKIIGAHMLKRMRLVYKSMTRTHKRTAWTVCLAFSKTLLEFAPFPDKPPTDLLSQCWRFVRMVAATRVVPVEGVL